MPILATNISAGAHGVPPLGVFRPGETREVPQDVAAWLSRRPEFRVTVTDPADLALRDAEGRVRYIEYFGPCDSRFGYGGAGITILRALTALGVEALVSPHYNGGHEVAYTADLPNDARQHLVGARRFLPQVALCHCLPDDLPRNNAPRKVAWTMFETDRIPDGRTEAFGDWAALINEHAERLVVPCKHNAELFARCGVERPITVLPYGLDADIWPYTERPERDTFTIVQYGDLTSRKGPQEAAQAFQLAFPNEQNVRLVLKTQGHVLSQAARYLQEFRDPRISVVSETWSRAQLVQFLHRADCFIWLSRGEGFGLPPLQAALTGLPVVMTTHTGMAEYHRPQFFYGVRDAGMSTAPLGGQWYDPDVEHAAQQLRKVYEDRKTALKRAKSAATYVRKNFSLEAFAGRLGAFLETV